MCIRKSNIEFKTSAWQAKFFRLFIGNIFVFPFESSKKCQLVHSNYGGEFFSLRLRLPHHGLKPTINQWHVFSVSCVNAKIFHRNTLNFFYFAMLILRSLHLNRASITHAFTCMEFVCSYWQELVEIRTYYGQAECTK